MKASGEKQVVVKLQQLNNKCSDSLKQFEPHIFRDLYTGEKKRFKQKVKVSSFTWGVVAVEGFKLHAFKTELHF